MHPLLSYQLEHMRSSHWHMIVGVLGAVASSSLLQDSSSSWQGTPQHQTRGCYWPCRLPAQLPRACRPLRQCVWSVLAPAACEACGSRYGYVCNQPLVCAGLWRARAGTPFATVACTHARPCSAGFVCLLHLHACVLLLRHCSCMCDVHGCWCRCKGCASWCPSKERGTLRSRQRTATVWCLAAPDISSLQGDDPVNACVF